MDQDQSATRRAQKIIHHHQSTLHPVDPVQLRRGCHTPHYLRNAVIPTTEFLNMPPLAERERPPSNHNAPHPAVGNKASMSTMRRHAAAMADPPPHHSWLTSPARSHTAQAQGRELPLHLVALILSYVCACDAGMTTFVQPPFYDDPTLMPPFAA